MRRAPITAATIAVVCVAQTLAMLGANAVHALLPEFQALWGLSNAEAGWLVGGQYAGFMAAVPFLTAATDRIDPRRIYLGGLCAVVAGSFAFALWADGFWSGLAARVLYGAGFGAAYMPGLRALTDGIDRPSLKKSAVTWYLVAFSAGVAGSILLASEVERAHGLRWALLAHAFCAVAALAICLVAMPARRAPPERLPGLAELLDYRPVLRSRQAMAYISGYAAHSWEMFAVMGWLVAFLAFARAAHGGDGIDPATAVTIAAFVGLPASLLGGEIAARWDRRRWILLAMAVSAVLTLAIGPLGAWSYDLAAAAAILLIGMVYADSPPLTAGLVENAPPGKLGAAMGLHACVGFGCGFVGPLVFGVALDGFGAASFAGWTAAFATSVAAAAAGWTVLLLATRARS